MTPPEQSLRAPRRLVRPTRDDRISDALERIHHASQRLVKRRLELALEQTRRLLVCTGAAGTGALIALGGWALAVASGIRAIDDESTAVAVGLGVGVLHVVGGLLLIVRALRATRAGEDAR